MRVIQTTCAADEAEALLDALLAEHLVGCGNLIPGVRSRYRWQGDIQDDEEVLLVMETTKENAPAAAARLRALHSYDVPKILTLAPSACDTDYLRWLADVTRPGGDCGAEGAAARDAEADAPDAWLARDPLPAEPVAIVERWLGEAFEARAQENPHAVALATVDPDGRPSVRMVLCSHLDAAAGRFTIYTNIESRKGRAVRHEPRAALVFHWGARQVRVEGNVEPTPDAQCDAYFASRPLEARLGAWASAQSEPVGSRDALLEKLREVALRFGAKEESDPVPRPPHWGGLTLVAESVELWVSRTGRIHDRAVWRRSGSGWNATRLQP